MFYLASKSERNLQEKENYCSPSSSADGSSIDSNSAYLPHKVTFTSCNEYFTNDSPTNQPRTNFKKRASHIILQVPVEQIRRMKDTEGLGSISRETQHFSQTTTMHGPKRIYQGKKFSTYFWVLMMLASLLLLIYQVTSLITIYISKSTLSQVSFLINENGMDFPMVTICNYNPVRKSYIQQINKTGDFSDQLLDYLMQSLTDTEALYGNADRAELHVGDRALQIYKEKHENFTVQRFFRAAGLNCTETFKLCTFGGRQFDCCKYMETVLTNLGKCHTLDLREARENLQKQTYTGVNAGLLLALDTHMEEQMDGVGDEAAPLFTNAYENGFRYYVHAPDTIPYLVSEGISVSPGSRVYSAIAMNRYLLLPPEEWGNCSEKWPHKYSTDIAYSAVNCESLCKAKYFYDLCGCSPFTYNIDGALPLCSPYQTVQCIDQHIRIQVNGTDHIQTPSCNECASECNSEVYHAYNSYGYGFSEGALKYLHRKNPEWTKSHMKLNFVILNVFFRDMSHMEYRQVQATSLTETLSDIGGNMGMFLGMSLITVTELTLFISKIGWIAFSKRRRDYLYNKKKREQEREKQLEETVSTVNMLRSRKLSANIGDSFRRLRSLSKHIRDSMRKSRQEHEAPPALKKVEAGTCTDSSEKALKSKQHSLESKNSSSENKPTNGTLPRPDSIIELKIDLRDLRKQMNHGLPVSIKRRHRANTAPPASRYDKTWPYCEPFYTNKSGDPQISGEAL